MNVLMCVNDAYVYPLLTLMSSIRDNYAGELNLYILSTKLSEKSVSIMEKKLKELNISLSVQIVDFSKIEFNKEFHYSVDMFLRIYAFDLLPKEIDKILYLDADMIVLNDLSELYNQNIDGRLFGVVPDPGAQSQAAAEYIKANNFSHIYFNSGMLLMNLSQIRKVWDFGAIDSTIKERAKLYKYPDQDLLNYLCKEKDILILDKKFNHQIRADEKLNENNIVVLHYVGYLKPWNHFCKKKHEKLFWRAHKKLKLKSFKCTSFKLSLIQLNDLPKRAFRKIKKILKRK